MIDDPDPSLRELLEGIPSPPGGETASSLVAPESLIAVLGVVYVHKKTTDGGDLYLTRFGLPYSDLLAVENWYEREWFRAHRERLEGTSAVYRVSTREVAGRSIELVVKNCRVGEDVPLETKTLLDFINAEFNSPWEEFSLVMEMREGRHGPQEVRINAQEPLAIYVPPGKMQSWQSGRSVEKINRIRARHPGIDIDILRQYKLIYGWIKGKNAVRLLRETGVSAEGLDAHLKPITEKAIADLSLKGYAVMDMKPAHVIIGESHTVELERMGTGGGDPGVKTRQEEYVRGLVEEGEYSIVDYELLIRTPAHEEEVNYSRRHSYLDDQRDRFLETPLPAHLKAMEVQGVPYVFGHAESTGGKVWVVGRNPRLFDYFLPERWRKTHAWKLSETNEVYYTFTKDHVHVVWKTSRVGEKPPRDKDDIPPTLAEEQGFNSPFEEFAIAHHLGANGIPTVYVRAIYRTGSPKLEPSPDPRRFETHREILDPDGEPVLRSDRNYITIRGYYNGSDRWVSQQRGRLCRPLDLLKALTGGYITPDEYRRLLEVTRSKLRNIGYDGSLLRPNDLLIVLSPDGEPLKDAEGLLEVRISNFELLRKV